MSHIIHKDDWKSGIYEHCLGCYCNVVPEPCPTQNQNIKVIDNETFNFMVELGVL